MYRVSKRANENIMKYLLGIDLGTSSLKGSVYTADGNFIYSSASAYSLITPQKGFSEQNPHDWIDAFINVIYDLEKKIEDFDKDLEALSFSGQMHSLVLLDQNNQVLRNAILWNDVRTTSQCKKIMENYGDDLVNISKNIALEGFTLPKILWVKENEADIWEKVKHILLPKDYLRYWITGKYNMDYSDAAGTLLLDIDKKEWSDEVASQFEIDKNILPPLVESIGYVGDILPDIQYKLGIKNKVKVYAGAADNAASAVGSGITTKDKGMISIGTSGVVLANKVNLTGNEDGKLHTFNHAIPGSYYSMGVTLAAGKSLDWLKTTFGSNMTFDEFLEGIENVSPGSEGLMFTPYIQGERTPYNDSSIRGSFVGVDISHNLPCFTRAVVEGITFSIKDSLEIIDNDSIKKIDNLVSVGGGAKNKSWLQIQANILNKNIITLEIENGPSTGAAMIAAVGLGYYEDFEQCANDFVSYKDEYMPDSRNVEIYKDYYMIYKTIYQNTKDISKELLEI